MICFKTGYQLYYAYFWIKKHQYFSMKLPTFVCGDKRKKIPECFLPYLHRIRSVPGPYLLRIYRYGDDTDKVRSRYKVNMLLPLHFAVIVIVRI